MVHVNVVPEMRQIQCGVQSIGIRHRACFQYVLRYLANQPNVHTVILDDYITGGKLRPQVESAEEYECRHTKY